MEYLSHSPEETEHIGEMLGRRLRPGTVVAYRGGLGMGKTAFTRGLARGLGCAGRVTSPTFTIVNEYDGATPLFHFDMYRLASSEELFEAVWGEKYLESSNNTVMAHIGRLREKLHEPARRPKFIKTVWGVGYQIED